MVEVEAELLVKKGLLPENLPPVFTSDELWTALWPKSTTYQVTAKAVGEGAHYNASKRGGQRRVFHIPHPVYIKEQGIFYKTHWADIQKLFDKAPGSLSKPSFEEDEVRHVRITPHSQLPKERLKAFSRFKYVLVADVSRFYELVYTHTLPWAINGKDAAKADSDWKSKAVFGNRLDFLIRQAQSRQTQGIPVGPDSSDIAGEIVLSAVDKEFIRRSKPTDVVYRRHVDDYWVGGHTIEECERHLALLRLTLRQYQLDINEAKTKIVLTRTILGDTWPKEFEKEIAKTLGYSTSDFDVLAVLAKVVDFAAANNDDGIIRHIMRVIDRKELWAPNWSLLQHFIAQCSVQFPHSFDYAARVVAWRLRVDRSQVDTELWWDIAKNTIKLNTPLGRDAEVCWGLYLAKELNKNITKAISDPIIDSCNGLVLAFLAHFKQHKVATDPKIYDRVRKAVDGEPFAGRFWPLALELAYLKQADTAWASSETLEVLRSLHKHKASIIDWSASPKVFVETDFEGEYPDYAIEDYGLDYDNDDEDEDDLDDEDKPGEFPTARPPSWPPKGFNPFNRPKPPAQPEPLSDSEIDKLLDGKE